MSRGYTLSDASSTIVEGFMDPSVKELPLEFSVELARLVNLEMEHPGFNYPQDLK
jgi:Fe-S cluster assembly protein SufB